MPAKEKKIKVILNFDLIVLGALVAKGDQTTVQLKEELAKVGVLDPHPILGAVSFWDNWNVLETGGDITSDRPLDGPGKDSFCDHSVIHSMTAKGRETLAALQKPPAPEVKSPEPKTEPAVLGASQLLPAALQNSFIEPKFKSAPLSFSAAASESDGPPSWIRHLGKRPNGLPLG